MFRKGLIYAFAAMLVATVATAEPIRTLRTKENKLPEKYYLELGAAFEFTEFDENSDSLITGDNEWRGIGKARYAITENWTILTEVPYVDYDPSIGDGESGLGDITVGTELRVYEDVLGFPWIMPHAEVNLDTASEDVLGAGETTYMVGLAIGTVVDDFAHELGISGAWHFILDGRYHFLEDDENVASVALAVIWEISDQFATIFEAEFSDADESTDPDAERPQLYQAGFAYDATENFQLGAAIGGYKNSSKDVVTTVQGTYHF